MSVEDNLPPFVARFDGPAHTWSDTDGPMVEPEHPVWIDDKVRAALADLNPGARKILEITGRRVSNRLAAERAAAEANTDAYQAEAGAFARHLRVPPRGASYIPRTTSPAPLAAPRQSVTTPRSAA